MAKKMQCHGVIFLEQKFMDGNLFSLAGTVIDRFAAEAKEVGVMIVVK